MTVRYISTNGRNLIHRTSMQQIDADLFANVYYLHLALMCCNKLVMFLVYIESISFSALGFARAYDSTKKLCEEIDLKAPARITSVNMRKYCATLAQVCLTKFLLFNLMRYNHNESWT